MLSGDEKRICGIVEKICGIDCRLIRQDELCHLDNPFCRACAQEQKTSKLKCAHMESYAFGQSKKWGGKYEFLCPCGCVFVAAALEEDDALLAGPFLMVEKDDFVDSDLYAMFGKNPKMEKLAENLPYFGYKRVPYLTDMMFALCSFVTRRDSIDINVLETAHMTKNEIYESLYKLKDGIDGQDYPMNTERMLQYYISTGDKENARRAMNEILAHIYFASGGDFSVIKARVIELTVLLSRAAIQGGADVSEIFGINANYISQIISFDNEAELDYWLAHALTRYTGAVFNVAEEKYSKITRDTINFIHKNCVNKLVLNDIADHVKFSVSYVSRVFKEETGENISSYINKVRIERARALLMNPRLSMAEVAEGCGFEDQSYFNKVFKSGCGMTPKQFRQQFDKTFRDYEVNG